jgi:hypothetical protein
MIWKALEPHGLGRGTQMAIDETWFPLRFKVGG